MYHPLPRAELREVVGCDFEHDVGDEVAVARLREVDGGLGTVVPHAGVDRLWAAILGSDRSFWDQYALRHRLPLGARPNRATPARHISSVCYNAR